MRNYDPAQDGYCDSPRSVTPSKSRHIEIASVVGVLFLLIASQWDLWISHRLMATHDTLRYYPVFAFFADSIQKGIIPLWDPYLEMGQPFFVISPEMIVAWQPWTLLLIFLGKCLGIGLLSLFHLHLLLLFIIFTGGAYLLFRHLFESRAAAFAAFTTLVLSSLSYDYLSQMMYIQIAAPSPWLLLSFLKLLEESNPRYLLLSAWILGITTGAYHVVTVTTFVGLLLAALFFSKSIQANKLKVILMDKRMACMAGLVLILLSLRAFSQLWYLKDLFLILRWEVHGADSSRWVDFATLVSPYFFVLCRHYNGIHGIDASFVASMGTLYIGLLPLLLALLGIWFSPHRYKTAFLLTSGLLVLLMLGHNCYAFSILKYFPAFLIIRNTTDFHVFFILCLCFFVGCGTEVVLKQAKRDSTMPLHALVLLGGGVAFAALGIAAAYRIRLGVIHGHPLFFLDAAYAWRYSWINAAWFVLGVALIAWLVKTHKPRALLLALALFALPDLFCAGQGFLRIFTEERGAMLPSVPQDTLAPDRYLNRRVPAIPSLRLANFPSILKEFTAYHRGMKSFHFVELKDSFELRRIRSTGGLDVAAGVSADKLRLVKKAVLMSHYQILQAMNNVKPKDFLNFIFVEENLPTKFAALQTSLEKAVINTPVRGRVDVTSFGINNISMEVDSPADCLLYYSDAYADSWEALVERGANEYSQSQF